MIATWLLLLACCFLLVVTMIDLLQTRHLLRCKRAQLQAAERAEHVRLRGGFERALDVQEGLAALFWLEAFLRSVHRRQWKRAVYCHHMAHAPWRRT